MVEFAEKDIQSLGRTLGLRPKRVGNHFRFEFDAQGSERHVVVEIYPNIDIGKRKGNLVSVYTSNAHLQLHFCTGYVVSKMLGEVTFVGETDGKLSGLTVEKGGGCSLYANVDREILSGDFTTLGPEVMLSGIALSLSEGVLPSPPMSEEEFTNEVVGSRRRNSASRMRTKKVRRG
ncbi:MAG TPA: hypothetical protein VMM57_04445 [Bacteroidota bacterium]|nr:hypothetical protein [Bacteroidota bacterium]